MNKRATSVLDYLYEAPGPKTKRRVAVWTGISFTLLVLFLGLVLLQFYKTGQFEWRYWSFFFRATTWIFFAKGLWGTLEAAVLAGFVAFTLGFVMMLGRFSYSKIVQKIAVAFIEFTRGVPTLLFIYFFFLGLPLLGIKLPALLQIALPVAISASGTVAEALRSGVLAVPQGQKEAAQSLGLSRRAVFFKVLFPQGFKYVIPSLISEIVIVVKDTTFAYIVSFPDLMQNAKVIISNYDAMLSVYLFVAIVYIVVNYLLNKLSTFFANRSSGRKH